MTADTFVELADELGLDIVGAAPVAAYTETERHIRERRARGLFADMKFTIARPEISCHPESLLDGARTVVSAALCYWAEEPERPDGHGRLPIGPRQPTTGPGQPPTGPGQPPTAKTPPVNAPRRCGTRWNPQTT